MGWDFNDVDPDGHGGGDDDDDDCNNKHRLFSCEQMK